MAPAVQCVVKVRLLSLTRTLPFTPNPQRLVVLSSFNSFPAPPRPGASRRWPNPTMPRGHSVRFHYGTQPVRGDAWSAADVEGLAHAGGNARANACLERWLPEHWARWVEIKGSGA